MLDRQSCDEIRDTAYRSAGEREWFLNRCVTPTEPPPPVSQVEIAVAPPPEVTAAPLISLEELVCSYGWDCSWALAVMYCESGGDPNAYNPAGPYVGLFQLLDPSGTLFDPAVNIAEAYWKYLSLGPGAWRGCP